MGDQTIMQTDFNSVYAFIANSPGFRPVERYLATGPALKARSSMNLDSTDSESQRTP